MNTEDQIINENIKTSISKIISSFIPDIKPDWKLIHDTKLEYTHDWWVEYNRVISPFNDMEIDDEDVKEAWITISNTSIFIPFIEEHINSLVVDTNHKKDWLYMFNLIAENGF